MRKLRLDVESIEVTTFETDTDREDRGTVRGHNPVPPPTHTCGEIVTCAAWGTCYETCDPARCQPTQAPACNTLWPICPQDSANTGCPLCQVE